MTVESPLCPFTKMLVNVVRKRLTDQVEAKNILCIDQAGFRRDREVLQQFLVISLYPTQPEENGIPTSLR